MSKMETYTNQLAAANGDKETIRKLLAEMDAQVVELDAAYDNAIIEIKRLSEKEGPKEIVQPLIIDSVQAMLEPLETVQTYVHKKVWDLHVQYDPLIA